ALACFWLVFVSCLPAALPFFFLSDPTHALRVSNVLLIAMLFWVGQKWAEYAHTNRIVTGLVMMGIGLALVGVAVALGGGRARLPQLPLDRGSVYGFAGGEPERVDWISLTRSTSTLVFNTVPPSPRIECRIASRSPSASSTNSTEDPGFMRAST